LTSSALAEGLILLDKPAGQTSFQSLGTLKRALRTRRVGHAGTLDKFADGLLVVLCGRMTRLCPLATSLEKEYSATFRFGEETDTLDPEGRVVARGPLPSGEAIQAALNGFRGTILQVPPVYSAIHVGGQRASEAVRRGQEVRLKARTVTVFRLDLVDYAPPDATLRIVCSKGTYVRALARDVGSAVGSCAHVIALRRTRIGGFRVEDAHSPGSFRTEHVLPPAAFFSGAEGLRKLVARGNWAGAVSKGLKLHEELFESPPDSDGIYGVFSADERLLAVVQRTEARLRYVAAFPETPGGEAG